MYLFYVDESGNLDPSTEGIKPDGTRFAKDHLYVLTAISLFETRWRGFEATLNGKKNSLAESIRVKVGRPLDLDECEIKSNWLRNPREREKHIFLANLTEENRTDLVELYFKQLAHHHMVVFSVVIDKRHLHGYMDSDKLHRKAWELLLERIQGFLQQEHPKHNGVLVVDDISPQANRKLALKHAYILREGTSCGRRLTRIIEMPLFVCSGLSNGVQLADLVSYNIYRAFREEDIDYPYFRRILPYIWSSKLSPGDKLDGLKVFPPESPLVALAVEAGKKLARDQAAPSLEFWCPAGRTLSSRHAAPDKKDRRA